MRAEKNNFPNTEKEHEPTIIIKKSTDAPAEVKQNPFYDPEFWGHAYSLDDIYLPDSDEAISFGIAAHEIGHLVEEGKKEDARLDNFKATRAEEQRAWDRGRKYLQKYLTEYYQNDLETASKIQPAFERIKIILMQATDLSKDMYLEQGALNDLSDEEAEKILKEKRELVYSEKGEAFRQLFEDVKRIKIGAKPDWNRFIVIIKKAVKDIISDNEK